MSAIKAIIFRITKKYKDEQRFFSQWMTTTFNALKIPCTTHHQAHNEECPERSFEELKCLADDIALHIKRTANLP
jgi:hypothetical protein